VTLPNLTIQFQIDKTSIDVPKYSFNQHLRMLRDCYFEEYRPYLIIVALLRTLWGSVISFNANHVCALVQKMGSTGYIGFYTAPLNGATNSVAATNGTHLSG
jgi:hypothetical protein